MIKHIVLTAQTTRLLGVCEPASQSSTCSILTSLEGGKMIQINGESYQGHATDHIPQFTNPNTYTTVNGESLTNDDAFLSNVDRGKLVYELPNFNYVFGANEDIFTESSDTFETIVSIEGNLGNYEWSGTKSDCKFQYSITTTPQIKRVYPSTVYARQDICFYVFTDQSSYGGRQIITSATIDKFQIDVSESNPDSPSTSENYQICGIVGQTEATDDGVLVLKANVGKYAVSQFAYSYEQESQYLVRTLPKIDILQSNTLYKAGGSIVSLRGSGFSQELNGNLVTFDDLEWEVLSATTTEITWQLPEKTTDSTQSYYTGGIGARAKVFKGSVSQINEASTPAYEEYFTDLDTKRNSFTDTGYTRVIETWFIPQVDANYTFTAVCDDYCEIHLSQEDMNPDLATQILQTSTYSGWRQYPVPRASTYKSDSYELTSGNHYYMKIYHYQSSGSDSMTVGMIIDDESTLQGNSQSKWETLKIQPDHDYEIYELEIPNPAYDSTYVPSASRRLTETVYPSYKLQFLHEKCSKLKIVDIKKFCVTTSDCICVTPTFNANTTASGIYNTIKLYFNYIKSYYGDYMTVTKVSVDVNGSELAESADIREIKKYKFTMTSRMTIGSPSSKGFQLLNFNDNSATDVALIQNSTAPLTGKYMISFTRSNGEEALTRELSLDTNSNYIEREIFRVAPELIGAIEVQRLYSNYPSGNEGIELIYRVAHGFTADLVIVESENNPLTIPNSENQIDIIKNVFIEGSNKPFYEAIPAGFLRSVETSPQIKVTSNGMLSVCPLTPFCDIEFIENVAEITDRTETTSVSELIIEFTGTNIPVDELTTVSIGTTRSCIINYGETLSAIALTCTLRNPIAGDHEVLVQTKQGAILNSESITNLSVDLVVDSVTPTTIGTSGGTKITLQGDHYPLSLKEALNLGNDFSVTLDDKECKLLSVGRTQIVVISPSGLTVGSSPSLVVTLNGKVNTYGTTFTVISPPGSITAVSPTTVSPPIKQDLVITVDTLPSSNISDYVGLIEGPDEDLFMKVNSIDTVANTLTVRYPGSPDNIRYNVYIEYNGERYTSGVVLSAYAEITGYSIHTNGQDKGTISTTGGDIVTISGTGFSTNVEDMIIQFGDATATVLSSNDTEIIVKSAPFKEGETEIKVFIMLSIEAECGISSGWNITYDASQAPTVVTTGGYIIPNEDTVTITGTGFGDNPVAYIGSYTQETVSATATEIVIRLNKMNTNEAIVLFVETDDVNLPLIGVMTPFTAEVISVSPHTGSSGGEVITLSTIGIGLEYTKNHKIYYGSGSSSVYICQDITLIDSSTIQCLTSFDKQIPNNSKLKLSYDHISYTTGVSSTLSLTCLIESDCYYSTNSALTPLLTVSTSGSTYTGVTSGFSFDSSQTYISFIHFGTLTQVGSLDISSKTVTATFNDGIPPGTSSTRIKFSTNDRTFYSTTAQHSITLNPTATSVSACSWAGGCSFTINQSGIKAGVQADNQIGIQVGLTPLEALTELLEESTAGSLVVRAPSYFTTHSLNTFELAPSTIIHGTVTSKPVSIGELAFDGITSSQFKSTTTDNCYVQVAFSTGRVGRLQKVKFFMNRMDDKQKNFVGNLKFQYYDDVAANDWVDSFVTDTYLREGWNEHKYETPIGYNKYRFLATTRKACQIGEVQLWGHVVEVSEDNSKSWEITLSATGNMSQVIDGASITYSDAATAIVTEISPKYGTYKGGESITITGEGFSTTLSEISVLIDDVECAVDSATSTEIICTTGERTQIHANPYTMVRFTGITPNGYAVMQGNTYIYANYWSDSETWMGEFAPQKGDSIVIPRGQTLIVDIDSSPILKAVIVQGALIFEPDDDESHHRTFDAEYIYVDQEAKLQIGTEDDRYTSKLTITMHGVRESPQIPIYGNKGIFVRRGTLDIHGKERDFTWTDLGETVDINSDEITLYTEVDWQAGECIVIAPTDFEATHAEEFWILGTSTVQNSDGDNVTKLKLDGTTKYKHWSGTLEYSTTNTQYTHTLDSVSDTFSTLSSTTGSKTKSITMRAEVGLLTRNVVYKGADDDSIKKQYGAHIMLHSSGDDSLTGRISYVELMQVGQAFQLGRYPIHFHMIGNVHNSYIRGNSIHHTFNRACTIHGVHYLTLEDNVAYNVMGHTFFIEDGAETKNYLKNNLAINTRMSFSLLNTDQSPASFWITHPDNQFINNHAAGSTNYGFWFDLQIHPTGPSFDPSICPEFDRLGEFSGNVAHSNGRYGLRIFHRFTPTDNPCGALATGAHNNRDQPSELIAAPIDTYFRNFTGYKNQRSGIIAEEFGALKFVDIKVSDNLLSGVEFGITAAGPWLSSDDDYQLQDALIVGYSEFAEEGQTDIAPIRGIKGARTEKMRVRDILFAHWGENNSSSAIGTCSHCEGPATDSSGRTYFFRDLYFYETPNRVRFDVPFKEIIYDEDGTLGSETHRWIVHYFKHLDTDVCTEDQDAYNGLVCSRDISIRRIVFYDGVPFNALKGMPIKILNLNKTEDATYNSITDHASCPYNRNALNTLYGIDDIARDNQLALEALYEPHGQVYTQFKEVYDTRNSCTTSCGDDTNGNFLGGCYVQDNSKDSTYYCNSANKATLLAFNPEESCEIACAVKCDLYLCKESTYNSSLTELTALVDQRDEDYGKYDLLWKTDGYYCNAENYAEIEFRPKNNPHFNWVFPIITSYEYNVHFGKGIDFEQLTGEYSYPELLQGEARGTVIHINNTERAEAYYFKYTNSDGVATQINSTSDRPALTSSSQMGDLFMNNVTRHNMLKFDGQNNDTIRFTLIRKECITVGGCNNKDQALVGEIEKTPRYWSNPKSWSLGRVPIEGEDIIIEPTWNMILDIAETPLLRSIEINGRLTIQNDRKDYLIKAYLIFIRAGELIVGTEELPFTGTVIFELHGDRGSLDIYFNEDMFEGGNKVIANTGKLRMYGQNIGTKWSRLAETAQAGQSWILLSDEPTDWAVGDELGLAPSGRDYTQRDFAIIQYIDERNITLAGPLKYTHYGAVSQNPEKSGGIDIRSEVLHLTRNIKVRGTNNDGWGGHIVTAHNDDAGFIAGQLVVIPRKGNSIIDNVEFVNCSQYDTDKAAVRFAGITDLNDDDIRSRVTNSVVHNGLGIGIMVTGSEEVLVDNNVVFFQHIGGIWMKKSNSIAITNNIVAGMGTRYWSLETKLDEIGGYILCNKDQNCKNLTLHNNIIAGCERAGFVLPTVSCSDTTSYKNNYARSVQHGAWLLDNTLLPTCQAFNSFKAYKTMEQGVFGFQAFAGNLVVSDIETMDCGRGVTLLIGQQKERSFTTLKDSTFWGESDAVPLDKGNSCISTYGIWSSSSVLGGKVYPEKKLPNLPFEKLKSYGNWFVETSADNIIFKNWKSAQRNCNSKKEQKILFTIETGSDFVPIQQLSNIIFDNVHNDAVARLMDPNPDWRNGDDCGLLFPCTAPHNYAWKFTNASAIGSIIPNINRIDTTGTSFQIIPNNPQATNFIFGCTLVTSWNANLCYNQRIAQLMFESLDDDTEDRAVVPINLLGQGTNSFNNTINSFMDHCWDGHYTCQKRLSRFPGLLETNKKYEIYYTGTPPKKTRYTMESGIRNEDWLHLIIDFSESRLYKVYDSKNLTTAIEPNEFSRTDKKQKSLEYTACGEYRFEPITYVYEFYLPYGCEVHFKAQDAIQGMVRLQMTYDEFFSKGGSTWFAIKLASNLGIPQSRIRFVGVYEGSVIIDWYIESDGDSVDSITELETLNEMLARKYQEGTLNFDDVDILDLVTQVVSSDGTSTSSTSNYSKKEISQTVIRMMLVALGVVFISLIFGIYRCISTTVKSRKVLKIDDIKYERQASQNESFDRKIQSRPSTMNIIEEVKSLD